ncbi:MAG: hypothetical protein COZ18_15140, partial [Flexibacter sp. CG_4_10_14_3_um_filter_32_15]
VIFNSHLFFLNKDKIFCIINELVRSCQYFNTLAGNDKLQTQIKEDLTEQEIKATWQKDLENYKIMRKKYLLYEDFE